LKFTGCVSSVALMSSRHILIVLSASHVTSLQGAQHTQENIPQELDNHRNITSTKNCQDLSRPNPCCSYMSRLQPAGRTAHITLLAMRTLEATGIPDITGLWVQTGKTLLRHRQRPDAPACAVHGTRGTYRAAVKVIACTSPPPPPQHPTRFMFMQAKAATAEAAT
jgi:hypothetical protein